MEAISNLQVAPENNSLASKKTNIPSLMMSDVKPILLSANVIFTINLSDLFS